MSHMNKKTYKLINETRKIMQAVVQNCDVYYVVFICEYTVSWRNIFGKEVSDTVTEEHTSGIYWPEKELAEIYAKIASKCDVPSTDHRHCVWFYPRGYEVFSEIGGQFLIDLHDIFTPSRVKCGLDVWSNTSFCAFSWNEKQYDNSYKKEHIWLSTCSFFGIDKSKYYYTGEYKNAILKTLNKDESAIFNYIRCIQNNCKTFNNLVVNGTIDAVCIRELSVKEIKTDHGTYPTLTELAKIKKEYKALKEAIEFYKTISDATNNIVNKLINQNGKDTQN